MIVVRVVSGQALSLYFAMSERQEVGFESEFNTRIYWPRTPKLGSDLVYYLSVFMAGERQDLTPISIQVLVN
jgi:hypothetical protein